MEHYTTEKNNDIVKVTRKWMKLENIIFSEVTQTQRDNCHINSLISGLSHKAKKTSPQITIPENLSNNEEPKRDIHRSILHEK